MQTRHPWRVTLADAVAALEQSAASDRRSEPPQCGHLTVGWPRSRANLRDPAKRVIQRPALEDEGGTRDCGAPLEAGMAMHQDLAPAAHEVRGRLRCKS